MHGVVSEHHTQFYKCIALFFVGTTPVFAPFFWDQPQFFVFFFKYPMASTCTVVSAPVVFSDLRGLLQGLALHDERRALHCQGVCRTSRKLADVALCSPFGVVWAESRLKMLVYSARKQARCNSICICIYLYLLGPKAKRNWWEFLLAYCACFKGPQSF